MNFKKIRKMLDDLNAKVNGHGDRLINLGQADWQMLERIKALESEVASMQDDLDHVYEILGLNEDDPQEAGLSAADLIPDEDASAEDINAFILRLAGGEDTAPATTCGPGGCS